MLRNKINMTFFKNFLPKIIVSTLIVLFLILAPFTVFPKLSLLNYSVNKEYKLDFQGVLTLWNVDTFEGGSISRTVFLEKRAIEFEKHNKGVYISVQNISLEHLKLNLQAGKKPNIITFGIGVENLFCNEVINLDNIGLVREDLLASAKIDGKLKALPIMLGGYTLISNKEKLSGDDICESLKHGNKNIIFSSNDSINPLMALFVNNITLEGQKASDVDSFDAYDKFIHNSFDALLGTQRDFYRCKNRENNMKMQCNYNTLGGFSDLIQYASVFSCEAKKEEICKEFLNYLISENVQKNLANINMFSVLDINIYQDEFYKQFNNILLKKIKTLNCFLKKEELDSLKMKLQEFVLEGKTENKDEIKKFLNI